MTISLAELYPAGRMFYDESDDPVGFVKKMAGLGLETSVTVEVPADRLDEFYALDLRVGT